MELLRSILSDLRYAGRSLRLNLSFSLAVILTLALGISANTIIFSLIDASLLRPLLYPHAERLARLFTQLDGLKRQALSPADLLDYQRQAHFFEGMAGFFLTQLNVTGESRSEHLQGAVVTSNFFSVLGINATIGRTFTLDDQNSGARLVVLSHSFWQTHYAGNPSVLSSAIRINGEPLNVVGVMPPQFKYPVGASLWVLSRYAVPEQPLNPTVNSAGMRDTYYVSVVARLRPDATLGQAQAEVSSIARGLKEKYADEEGAIDAQVISLHDDLVGEIKVALLVLLAAVVLLLLIACASIANIVVARVAARQPEIAVRAALGAGKLRLMRQLLSEQILLALLGGVLGIFLAYIAIPILRPVLASELIGSANLQIDQRVLAYGFVLALIAVVFFGVIPLLKFTRPNLNEVLREGGRGGVGGLHIRKIRTVLVVLETAISVVLLIGSGLLIRSFNRVLSVPVGFNTDHVLTFQVSLSPSHYSTPSVRSSFVQQALDKIQAIPGVDIVSAISRLPLSPGASTRTVDVEGRVNPSDKAVSPDYLVITPGYFRAMDIPLIQGRFLTEGDNQPRTNRVIVNEAMAKFFWPKGEVLGRHIKLGACENWCEIVGVVGDVRQHRLEDSSPLAVYVPYAEDPWPYFTFVVRSKTAPLNIAPAIETAIHGLDADEPVYNVRELSQVVEQSMVSRRVRTIFLGVFATIAVGLVFIGLYGVISYSAQQRNREIALRMALGARYSNVLSLVVGHALTLVGIGLMIGLVVSLWTAHFLSSMLYDVHPFDIMTFVIVSAILIGVALVASYMPALRAIKTDPTSVLRAA